MGAALDIRLVSPTGTHLSCPPHIKCGVNYGGHPVLTHKAHDQPICHPVGSPDFKKNRDEVEESLSPSSPKLGEVVGGWGFLSFLLCVFA